MVRGYSDELKEYLDIDDAEISQNPEILEERLKNIQFDGDDELLEDLRLEAHRTVDFQTSAINDVDNKASKLLRLNILLLGLIVSALSIATQLVPASPDSGDTGRMTALSLASLVNDYMVAGIAMLIFSIVFAALTYSTTDLDIGVGRDNLSTLIGADFDRADPNELLVKNYISRINWNRSASLRLLPLISSTIVLSISSLVLFSLGVHDLVFGGVPPYLWVGGLVTVGITVFATGLPKQSLRALADWREWRKDI